MNFSNDAVQLFIAQESHQRTLAVLTRLMAGETASQVSRFMVANGEQITSQAVGKIKKKYLGTE